MPDGVCFDWPMPWFNLLQESDLNRSMNSVTECFDVAIIGAGPAGATAAFHLARRGRRVALLEKLVFPRDKACGDGLTRGSVRLLAEMGLVEELSKHRTVQGARVVTGSLRHRDRLYSGHGVGFPDYGVVIPRRVLDHMVSKKAVQAGALLMEGTAATSLLSTNGRVQGVTVIRDGVDQKIPATFVVVADGGNSPFAKALGHRMDRWSAGFAVRGYFTKVGQLPDLLNVHVPLVDPVGHRVLAGYGWVFPLADSRANIGVGYFPVQDEDFHVNLRQVFDQFARDLRRHDRRFANMTQENRLQGAPLRFEMTLHGHFDTGILTVGDAAGLVDPFTGEGIYSAMESGKLAAQVLDSALGGPNPLHADLGEYGRLLERRFHERAQIGKRLLKTYGFLWKLLDYTLEVRQPLFENVRSALIDYGERDPVMEGEHLEVAAGLVEAGLSPDLDAVRRLLAVTISSDFPLLSKIAARTGNPRARVLRAGLVLLAACFGSTRNSSRISAAACVELSCCADAMLGSVVNRSLDHSLLHSEQFRSEVKWANMFSLMAGNYLLTKAFEVATSIGHEATGILSRASADVTQARMRDLAALNGRSCTEDECLQNLEQRKATVYDAACRVGAMVSDAPCEVVEVLATYGRNVGVAMELVNDVLDITAKIGPGEEHPIVGLIDQGKFALPMVLALRSRHGNELAVLLGQRERAKANVRQILLILHASGCLRSTAEVARAFIERAKESLKALPPGPLNSSLFNLADFVVEPVHSMIATTAAEPRVRFS